MFESIYRGDMYYIDPSGSVKGSEQMSGRPGIVVSNNTCNDRSPVVEIVYLTTQPKNDMPTHVQVHSAPRPSTALCEQVHSVSKERLSAFIGSISKEEQDKIDQALTISLGLNILRIDDDEADRETAEPGNQTDEPNAETMRLGIERDTYRCLYEGLLERIMRKERYGA